MVTRTRRARTVEPEFVIPDAIDGIVEQDIEATAEGLGDLLEELRGVTTANSEVRVYKATKEGGSWAYIKTLTPPLAMEGLFEELRDEWGGGEYFFRVRANGKIVTTKRATIAGDINPKKKAESENGSQIVTMMMNQSDRSKSDMMAMMQMMMQQSQNAQQQQMAMMQQSSQMMMGMMTAVLGSKESPAAFIAAMAPLLAAPKGNGFSEFAEILRLGKEMGSGAEPAGEESFMSLAGKALPALAEAVKNAQSNQQPPQQHMPPPRQLAQPVPAQYVSHPGMIAPSPLAVANPTSANTATAITDPLLALIAPDVLFFAQRQHSPALAADAVLEAIDKHGVTDDAVMSLVVSIQTAPDWRVALAAKGLDLTPWPEWADEFLKELITGYTENRAEPNDTGGESRSATDNARNGVPDTAS